MTEDITASGHKLFSVAKTNNKTKKDQQQQQKIKNKKIKIIKVAGLVLPNYSLCRPKSFCLIVIRDPSLA